MDHNFNVFQQIFGLSLASNAVRSCSGTSEELQKKLAENLPSLIKPIGPGWEVVWGPVVWKHENSTADQPPDNVWFVAKHPSLTFEDGTMQCSYVVAIAATTGQNIKSYDWKYEDFAVGSVVDLMAWIGGKGGIGVVPVAGRGFPWSRAWVANGTAKAVHTLANTFPTGTGQSPLAEWLKALDPPAGSRLIFTGHSLGGALSPTLAVTLSQAKCLGKFGAGCTLVYPTAGATPGNDCFAALFQDLFPPSGEPGTYEVWNQNVVNDLDVIPHAWCTDRSKDLNLHAINSIYGKLPSPKLIGQIWLEVSYLCLVTRFSWITYQPLNHSTFHGEMPSSPPQNIDEFLAQVHTQHLHAYGMYILGQEIPKPLCKEEKGDRYMSYPVLGTMYPHSSRVENAGLFEDVE